MSSIIYKFKFILTLIAFLTPVGLCTELTVGGPHNVVAYVSDSVTLHCDRDAPGGVTWWYIPPGSDLDQPITGTCKCRDNHSLPLENLELGDAGRYVCRSDRDPQSFPPASAYVVVVAQQPDCRADYTEFIDEDQFTVSCVVTYQGLLNLTLSVFRSDDNYTVVTRNYTSKVETSCWKLERELPANFSGRYVCRAKFYSSKIEVDIAKNRPPYIDTPCTEIHGIPHDDKYVEICSDRNRKQSRRALSSVTGVRSQILTYFLSVISALILF